MKNNLIACGVVLALVLGFVGLFTPAAKEVASNFGSTSNVESVDNPYTCFKGACSFQETVPFVATSSFIFSLKNPFGATTTIDFISLNGTSLIGTNPIYVSTGTTAFSTSTPALVAALAMVSNSKFSFDWVRNTATTTSTAVGVGATTGNPDVLPGITWRGNAAGGLNNTGIGQSNYILGPNEFLNINIATTTAGSFGTYMAGSGVTIRLRKI